MALRILYRSSSQAKFELRNRERVEQPEPARA